jgi:hypothetical protein
MSGAYRAPLTFFLPGYKKARVGSDRYAAANFRATAAMDAQSVKRVGGLRRVRVARYAASWSVMPAYGCEAHLARRRQYSHSPSCSRLFRIHPKIAAISPPSPPSRWRRANGQDRLLLMNF